MSDMFQRPWVLVGRGLLESGKARRSKERCLCSVFEEVGPDYPLDPNPEKYTSSFFITWPKLSAVQAGSGWSSTLLRHGFCMAAYPRCLQCLPAHAREPSSPRGLRRHPEEAQRTSWDMLSEACKGGNALGTEHRNLYRGFISAHPVCMRFTSLFALCLFHAVSLTSALPQGLWNSRMSGNASWMREFTTW